jgi:hypothetical protein
MCGCSMQGFEGFLSMKDPRRGRSTKIAGKEEYLFSLSSASSDVVRSNVTDNVMSHGRHAQSCTRRGQEVSEHLSRDTVPPWEWLATL